MNDLLALAPAGTWISLAIALLIGALVGAERETGESHIRIGLRDFVITSAIGWLCGVIHEPLVTALCVASIITLIVLHARRAPAEHGATTELSVLAVFAMAYAVALPSASEFIPLAIALAIVLTLLLDAKSRLKAFFHTSLTDVEFAAAVRFLALIFIVWPLMPDQHLGPYGFFHPRGLWQAVLLVSGISFVGYFLEKFFGPTLGARAVAILGGIVSTTAVTSSLATTVRHDPQRLGISWQSATLANAMQYPRVAVLLALFAEASLPTMLVGAIVAFALGLIMAYIIGKISPIQVASSVALKNPLQIVPALRFAASLAIVSFVSSWAFAEFGQQALLVTSALGSLVDVDAVIIAQAGLIQQGLVQANLMLLVTVVAITANVVVKIGISAINGTPGFAWRMALSMILMLAGFVAVVLLAIS